MNRPSSGAVRGRDREEETNRDCSEVDGRLSQNCEIPARSRLYQIKPEGVGTPGVECLSGYISRLSFEHLVTSGALITYELLQNSRSMLVPRRDGEGTGDRRYLCFATSQLVNAGGGKSKALIEGLERGTQMTGFENLTMLPFAKALSSRNLFAHVRRWCPRCYEDCRTADRAVCDLLLWTITDVTVCRDHQMFLKHTCPACKEQASSFSNYAIPGYCSHCRAWLGEAKDEAMSVDELGIWRAASVGDLLAMIPKLQAKNVAEILKQNVFACAEVFTSGQLAPLTRLSESKPSLHYPGQRLSLDNLLGICRTFGIPLTDLFSEQPASLRELSNDCSRAVGAGGAVPKRAQSMNIQRAAKRVELYSRTERRLTEILPRASEMTRQELAKELGVSLSYVMQNFSEVYKKIAPLMRRPRLEAQRSARNQRNEYIVSLVREEIRTGHFASYREIQATIPPGYPKALCTVKACVRRTRAELISTATTPPTSADPGGNSSEL